MTRKDKIDMLGKVLSGDTQAIHQLRNRQVHCPRFTDEYLAKYDK